MRTRVSCVLTPLVLLFSIRAHAQTEFGSITGSVVDSSDAPIPNVAVNMRNDQTTMTVAVRTGPDGNFASPPLRPGTYTLSVEVQGFRKVTRTLHLDIDQRARLNFVMEPGAVSETVTVAAESQLLETQTAALGNVRTTKAINDLPLNGRNFVQLFHIAAGVIPVGGGPTLGPSASNQTGLMGGAVNGSRPSNNDFRYDGIQSQDTDQNVLIFIPSPDAIQEFKVQTSAMDASFGRNGGATVNLIMKSGTNEYHGTAFEFLRNSALDAKNFFDSPSGPTPPFRLNQFGASFGGRIVRDRTFFFADYQGTRNRQAQTYLNTVPTDDFKRGDFSKLPLTLYDPATTRTAPAGQTGVIRDVFPGNRIPAERFNRAGKNLVDLYPAPNLPGIVNNYLYNPVRPADTNQMDARIDHRFRDTDNTFVRYSLSKLHAYNPSYLPAPALGNGPAFPGINNTMGQQVVLSHIHTFSPALVYEFRGGFSRLRISNETELQGTNLADKVGVPGINVEPRLSGIGSINVSGFRGLGQSDFNPTLKINNNFQYTHRLSYVNGKHSWKFGYELLRRQLNQFSPASPQGTFSFNGQFTQNPQRAAGTGSGIADMILGLQNSARLDIETIYGHRRWEHAWFANDDFRISNKLTLNLGLRYEITTPLTEVADRMGSLVPSLAFVYRVNTPQLPGHTVQATDFTNLAPRVGLAYQLTSKTVIRSGYGIFYSYPGIASGRLPSKSPPTAGNIAINNNTFDTDLTRVIPVSAGFPLLRPAIFDPTGSNFKYYPYNDPDAYVQQWNFNVQRELGRDTVLTAAYAGSRGEHLNVFPNINQPVPGAGPIASRRLYPLLANADGGHRAADSYYHSLQVTGEKRYAQGLSLLAAYTFSHSVDTASADTGGGPQDPRNLRADRGNSDFDIRQRFVLSWTYELPLGASRKFGSGMHGFTQHAFGGWQLNGIQTFMTGFRFTPSSAQNTLGAGSGGQRPDRIANGNLPSDERTLDRWFDIAAFRTPPPFTYGNAGRGILEGPGTKQVDLSVFKQFPLTQETRRLEFRAEFFNLFNTPQFNTPNASIGSTAAGRIDSAGEKMFFQRTSRQIQFALKLYF